MAREDICYANSSKEGQVPFVITGRCSGSVTLLQKVLALLFANTGDPGRSYGGNLSNLLRGTNAQTEGVLNAVNLALTEVRLLLQEENSLNYHDLPSDERLKSLTATSVVINGLDGLNIALNLETEAGVATFNITI